MIKTVQMTVLECYADMNWSDCIHLWNL